MTFSKTAMTVSSLAMAMLFGGGVYIMMNMNVLAKTYIERMASQTLGVSVSIAGLDITIQDRTAKVTELTIGNPEGFSAPFAVKVSGVNIVLGNISKQLVHFKDIDVSGAVVNLEVRENITNLAAIKNRIKTDNKEAEPVKVIIDKLTMSQAQLKPLAVLFTEDELQPVIVPDIVMTNIGQKENGVLAKEAVAQIWSHYADKLNTQALHSGLLEGMSPEALNDMGIGFAKRFKENLQENVQQKVDTIGENIDSFFND